MTRDTAVVMTFDPAAMEGIWLAHYFPELIEIERIRMPALDVIAEALGGDCEIVPVPIPFDCIDGFQEAFYGRPEAFLVKEVRAAQSAWGFLPEGGKRSWSNGWPTTFAPANGTGGSRLTARRLFIPAR